MKLVIDHLTRYGYDEEVKFSTQYLRLTPRSTARQTITAWTLTLPDGAAVTTTDGWGWITRTRRSPSAPAGLSISPTKGRRRVMKRPSCCRRWFFCAVRR